MDESFNLINSVEQKRKNIEEKSLEFISLDKKIFKRDIKLKKIKKNRAQNYIKEFRLRKNALIRDLRISRNMKKFFIPLKPKILFAVRIKGINGIPPKAKKILELLRLKKINNGVFLKSNASSIQILKKVDPYIAYGYPTAKTIRNLIIKKGFGKIGKRGKWQRIPLFDDKIVEQSLFRVGIHSLNDLINELVTGGTHFKEANNFLWPFKLKNPKKGFSKHGKNKNIAEMGAHGNWDDSINHLIKKMM